MILVMAYICWERPCQATKHWLLTQVTGSQGQGEILLGSQMSLSAVDPSSLSKQAAWLVFGIIGSSVGSVNFYQALH